MKKWKRIVSVLLAMVMVLGLGMTTLAANNDGSITIDNAVKGKTYSIYRVFDLEVDNVDSPSAYKYTLNRSWDGLASYSATIDDNETVEASSFFTVDGTDGHIEWVEDADAASFAKLLNAYQKEKSVNAVDSKKATESGTVTFTGLDLGYYFVQSDLGSLCSLDTTNPSATIKEKNSAPTVDKQVQEDSTGNYGDSDTADIGDTVNYQTTINVLDGDPKNYILHDKMFTGLTFESVSSVTVNGIEIGMDETTGTAYYTVTSSPTDGCTFDVTFTNLKPNDVIVVSYTATVNKNAVIGGNGNDNETWLTYGDGNKTTEDKTTTYVFDVDILKYTVSGNDPVDENDTKTPLSGAEFVLYKTVEETNHYAKVTGGKLTGWTTTKSEATTLTSDKDGKISVDGLDADTYYLEETKAPNGYNLLASPVKIKIDDNGNVYVEDSTTAATDGLVEVENKTGTELPSTGGIGATIFYIVGGILVVGAGIVLITRKRMSHAEE